MSSDTDQPHLPDEKSSPKSSETQKAARTSYADSLRQEADQALREMDEYIRSKKKRMTS